jgi:hypothetical protein
MGFRARLPEYTDGTESVWAAKISSVTPFTTVGVAGECAHLFLGDVGKHADVIARWAAEQNPQAGGYFVTFDDKEAIYMAGEEFEQRYKRVQP